MTNEKKARLFKALRYWGASYAVVAGFLYYKSNANLGSILIAGVLTLAFVVARVLLTSDPPR